MNPFLQSFATKYGLPPFDLIKETHFIPAIKEGIRVQKEEIKAIINNAEIPTFENTILGIENSGQIIKRTASVLYNLSYSNTNQSIQNITQKVAPVLSQLNDHIFMNIDLFKKVEFLYQQKHLLKESKENKKLLEVYYKSFVRNGAKLSIKDKKRVAEINIRLTILNLQFGQNILAAMNEYKLILHDKNQLKGMPLSLIASAKETAISMGMPGKWVFTLHNVSVIPFLQYAGNRSLREEIWTAYVNKGNLGDKNDNNSNVLETVQLRTEKSRLLGYKSHAHCVLEDQMSKSPDQVQSLLDNLWPPALNVALKELEELQKIIDKDKEHFALQPHDWRYYAEILRKEKYNLGDAELKPYFSINNVQEGLFSVASKLYGLVFKEIYDAPLYHSDASAFEVSESNGKKTGILLLDYFQRESKQGGAWMTSFTEQKKVGRRRILPVISIVCNFTKPIGDEPSLLTFDEVSTLFHEFGHALHGLLSNVTYASLSGTNVPTDFVELPSQFMENWASEPQVLKQYALHYRTKEIIPDLLIKKMNKRSKYGQGFATVEYLAATILDMSYHTIDGGDIQSVGDYENQVFNKIGLIPQIVSRYRSTHFSHIFSGGYAAGYYSYIWSEVLDADAFNIFKEKGIFNKEYASSFRRNILEEKGGS